MFRKKIICWILGHKWQLCNERDYLSTEIEKPQVTYLYLALTISKRKCLRCEATQEYLPPEICGGSSNKWL